MFRNIEKEDSTIFGITYKDFTMYALQGIGIFITTFLILFAFGITPDSIKKRAAGEVTPRDLSAPSPQTQTTNNSSSVQTRTLPTRVIINKIGVDSVIQHPQSPDIATLDAALTKGAVYYPGSGTIEDGNMFLFGHSTNWQVVRNQAYKTFNNLEKLSTGDSITVWGSDGEVYTYVVQSVVLVDDNEALVDFNKEGSTLTISTCNTFGAKQERWVVEAVLRG